MNSKINKIMKPACIYFLMICFFASNGQLKTIENIKKELSQVEGTFAVAYYNFKTKKEVYINEKEVFHAASTMKTPVMMAMMLDIKKGKIKLNEEVLVKNEFKSIVDGSSYMMELAGDSDDQIYNWIETKKTYEQLCYNMITVSSNLATNILIDKIGAKNIMAYLKSLSIENVNVLRGVEDSKAFKAGLNNNTTAKGMLDLYKVIYTNKKLAGRDKMIEILSHQKYNEMIPKYLPKGTKVAHKTGNITGVEHDCGIVFDSKGGDYAVVLLSKNLKDHKAGAEAIAKISKILYQSVK